jgi:copper homeostasis protein
MQSRYILEVSVERVAAAMAAERGGAQRIEFCSNAREGGTTPSPELLRAVRKSVHIPIFSMVRPRAGNFFYSDDEFAVMQHEVNAAKEFGMDGVVLGLLNVDGQVDVGRSKQLIECARPLPVTFHRAFDECTDLRESLEDVIKTGTTRLLTSGGKRTAPEGLEVLGELVRIAGDQIVVMPGSGIHGGNIRDAVKKTGAREFHAALSSVVADPANDLKRFEEEVRRLVTTLAAVD